MILEIANSLQDLPFHASRRNIYSQCGEDGVVEYLLKLIGVSRGYFVEFGAWDGRHLSNCAKLADEGWSGCFIEGDPERFSILRANCEKWSGITAVNAFVSAAGGETLDRILGRQRAPSEPTVLSIDIDGIDYHVWSSLTEFLPALCIVEFNPTIPANISYVQPNNPTEHRGSSLRALWRLAQQKGYALVAATDWNGFFLRTDVCLKHGVPTYTPEMVKDTRFETFIFHGFDGALITAGSRELLWHGIAIGEMELQVLPPQLRRFPPSAPPSYSKALAKFKRDRGE